MQLKLDYCNCNDNVAIAMIMLQLQLKQLVQEQEKNVAIAIETICTRRKNCSCNEIFEGVEIGCNCNILHLRTEQLNAFTRSGS